MITLNQDGQGAPTWLPLESPDPDILAAATVELVRRGVARHPPTWQIVGRFVRKRSTLFALSASVDRGVVEAYYKVERSGSHWDQNRHARWLTAVSQSLLAEQELHQSLKSGFGRVGIHFDEPLFIDVAARTGVRLAVPGAPLARSWRWRSPFLHASMVNACRNIGEALAVIEQIGTRLPVPPASGSLGHELGEQIELSQRVLGSLTVAVEASVRELLRWSGSEGSIRTWTHGDMSQTNILVTDNELSIIDFSWKPQLVAQDLVRFVARLECESMRLNRSARALAHAVLAGYGIDAGDPPPAYRLALIRHALHLSRSPRRRVRNWAVRRLKESIT